MDAVTRVVESTRAVASAAADVAIDDASLEALAARLAAETNVKPPAWDECGWHYNADAASGGPLTAQYVLVLDALNFCFWPSSSGIEYDTLASVLRDVLAADSSAFSAEKLSTIDAATLRSWFAPHDFPNAEERARKLNELGAVLARDFEGLAANLLAAAKGSAVMAVELVVRHFPGFRDESLYKGRQVFLYKRAQIFVADVWAAYGQRTFAAGEAAPEGCPAAFHDMRRLTCFADYRIPQLLHSGGVFTYSPELHAAVLERREITAGHPWEVEIRAATVVAVERIRERMNELRRAASAAGAAGAGAAEEIASVQVDWLLWQEGERRKDSILPHHRTLTVFY